MKKSKLLMPLIGLPVLAGVTPVIALTTSCGSKPQEKEEYKIFQELKVGNIYDSERLLYTNIIGYEKLFNKTYAEFEIVGHLSREFMPDHKLYMSIAQQGTSEDPFTIVMPEKDLAIPTYATYYFSGVLNDVLSVNQTVINSLIASGESKDFSFDVVFTEKDAEDKVVATETKKITLVANPTKHELPTISTTDFAPTGKTWSPKVTMSNVKFTEALHGNLNVKFQDDEYYVCDGDNTLTINNFNDGKLSKGTTNITITGTLATAPKTTGNIEFTSRVDGIKLKLEFTEEEGESNYIVNHWFITYDIAPIMKTGDVWAVTIK